MWPCGTDLIKRGLNGAYVAVEPFHLFRYIDDSLFAIAIASDESGRKLKGGERFDIVLSQIAGKRLTLLRSLVRWEKRQLNPWCGKGGRQKMVSSAVSALASRRRA